MKVAVLYQFNSPLRIEERPKPEPKDDEVLVKVSGCGVCHSDLYISGGLYPNIKLPLVLGHEIAGITDETGPVLVYASWGCGSCGMCKRGEEELCLTATEPGWVRDGGYAEYIVVPSKKYLLPLNGLDPIKAAPLADAGVTAYRAVQKVSSWLSDSRESGNRYIAVVIGLGGLGQFAVQYLKLLTNAHIVGIDIDSSKLHRARQLGADETMIPEEFNRSARVVLDFVGNNETLALASRVVERGGIVVQIGEAGGKTPFGMYFVPHEAYFTTSIWGSMRDLSAVLGYAHQGKIKWDVEKMSLDMVNEALGRVRRGEVLDRIVLVP